MSRRSTRTRKKARARPDQDLQDHDSDPDIPNPTEVTMSGGGGSAGNDVYGALRTYLQGIDGQDMHSSITKAVGRLAKDQYLAWPEDVEVPAFNAEIVGSEEATHALSAETLMQIYALNKTRAKNPTYAKEFALLRVGIIMAGFYPRPEDLEIVKVAPASANAMKAVIDPDMGWIVDQLPLYQRAGYILPFASEHVFRTLGHHFITTDAPTYEAKYNTFLGACLEMDVAKIADSATRYYDATHWISLRSVRNVLMSVQGRDRLPNAVIIRAESAPAGTAIICTTAAVLESSYRLASKEELQRVAPCDLELIHQAAANIARDPFKFHLFPHAYGLNDLPGQTLDRVRRARKAAIRMASYAQGYIDAMPRSASLTQAKALKKHAMENPSHTARVKIYFRNRLKTKADNLQDLFSLEIKEKDDSPVAGDDDVDEYDDEMEQG